MGANENGNDSMGMGGNGNSNRYSRTPLMYTDVYTMYTDTMRAALYAECLFHVLLPRPLRVFHKK